MTAPNQKITFGQMRASGVRGLLIYCSDFRCSHWTAISGDRFADDFEMMIWHGRPIARKARTVPFCDGNEPCRALHYALQGGQSCVARRADKEDRAAA